MKWGKVLNISAITFSIIAIIDCAPVSEYKVNLLSDDAETRLQAMASLHLLGSRARRAENEIAKVARDDPDPEIRRMALETLGKIKPIMTIEITDAFIFGLNDSDVNVRRSAVIGISFLENYPPNILYTLQRKLGDPDKLVRELTMSAFMRIGSYGVRALLKALCDSSNTVCRLSAVVTLGNLREDARLALKALKYVKEDDSDVEVRKAASDAIKFIKE